MKINKTFRILAIILLIVLTVGITIYAQDSDTEYCQIISSPDKSSQVIFENEAITCSLVEETKDCTIWKLSGQEGFVELCNE